MSNLIEGMLLGKGLKFGVVVSRFNEFISKKLLEGAEDALLRHGVNAGDIDVAWVPGSFEIPLIAQKLAFVDADDPEWVRIRRSVLEGILDPSADVTAWKDGKLVDLDELDGIQPVGKPYEGRRFDRLQSF